MKELPKLKPIDIAGKKVNPYLFGGAVLFIVLIAVALLTNLAPTEPLDSALKGLNLEIFKKIGVGLKIDTKEEAAQSIGSIAKELEKAIGTVKSINNNLEGGVKEQPVGPSGLAGLTGNRTSLPGILVALLTVAIGIRFLTKKESNPFG